MVGGPLMGYTVPADADLFTVERDDDTLTLPAPWCKVQTLAGLKRHGAQRKGNLVVPRAHGEVPMPRRRGALSVDLRLILLGDTARDGSPSALSPRAQMQDHIDFLLAMCEPVDEEPWTLDGSLVLTSIEETRAAGVQLELLDDVEDIWTSWGRCTLNVNVPLGKFEVEP